MNILLDELPRTIEIDGVDHLIRCDYRTCIRIIMAFNNNEFTMQEKQFIMLSLLYHDIPENIQLAADNAIWFLDGGTDREEDEVGEQQKPLYSFSNDASYIYSAFRQTHGIDLQNTDLHWWKFIALFMDLGSDTTFTNIVGLRKRYRDGTATKEEKKIINEMGDVFDVPEFDNRTLDEKVEEYEALERWKANSINS